jgi:hypothetical protein
MDYSLAKELKDAGFPQNGKSCDTHSDINDSTLVERVVHPTLSELIEACRGKWVLTGPSLGRVLL